MDPQRGVDEGRVHPHQQRGVVGAVAVADDVLVHRAHRRGGGTSLLGRAEHDRERCLERALQPGERVGVEAAVLGDGGRNHRVRELHKQRPPAAEEEDALAVDSANHRVGGEETGCADGAAGQAAASTRPYSVVRCSSGRPRGSTISPNERSSMRWPCDAPAAREMFSSIRVPPRSFAPAAST